jgi:tetratricopeptide (TPR) repeat protein
MDRLDRISIWAIVVLIITSFALISGHMGEARPERNPQQRAAVSNAASAGGEMAGRVKLARNLMEAGNLAKAEVLVRDLIQKYPYEGEPRMVMGDIYMRRQEPVRGMLEYKEAVDLNPDYLDKKTPVFQGKKLKIAVREALAEIDEGIRRNPADEPLKKDRKTLYYLQRRIAGSCS